MVIYHGIKFLFHVSFPEYEYLQLSPHFCWIYALGVFFRNIVLLGKIFHNYDTVFPK